MDPISCPAVIGVKVMGTNSPPVSIPAGPAGSSESLVIGSPPLILPVHTVLVSRLHVETDEVTVLGDVDTLLEHVVIGVASLRACEWCIRQRKSIQQRQAVRIPAISRNNIADNWRRAGCTR